MNFNVLIIESINFTRNSIDAPYYVTYLVLQFKLRRRKCFFLPNPYWRRRLSNKNLPIIDQMRFCWANIKRFRASSCAAHTISWNRYFRMILIKLLVGIILVKSFSWRRSECRSSREDATQSTQIYLLLILWFRGLSLGLVKELLYIRYKNIITL